MVWLTVTSDGDVGVVVDVSSIVADGDAAAPPLRRPSGSSGRPMVGGSKAVEAGVGAGGGQPRTPVQQT